MRSIFFFLLLPVLAFAAKGEPIFPAEGIYTFQNQYELLQKKRHEVVYSFTDEGRARMTELQAQGYSCSGASRDTFLCTKFEQLDGENPGLAERLAHQLKNKTLVFGAVRGSAGLIRKGDSNVEWSMPQSVEFNGKHYDSYRFLLHPASGLQRIFLGEPSEQTFVVSDSGALGYSLETSVTESRTAFRRYFGLAGFSR